MRAPAIAGRQDEPRRAVLHVVVRAVLTRAGGGHDAVAGIGQHQLADERLVVQLYLLC